MNEDRACPCLHTTPCAGHLPCTCVNPESSRGCSRCCTYGSPEQQKAKAERLAKKLDERPVRVGVAAIVRREGRILMGRRKGSHGAGTWSFPGGHLEWNESVAECAARELFEETGLKIPASEFRKLTYTNDVFTNEDKHYVTLYMEVRWENNEEPWIMEPTKCSEWVWTETAPEPLFLPVQNLLREGWQSALWKK